MRNLFWGVVLVMFGILLLLDNLDIADFGDVIKTFWPLIIIAWGASILLRRRMHHATPQPDPSQPSTQGSATLEQELLHESNVFGDLSLTVSSQNFKGGSLSAVFGNCHLDLSKAQFAEGEHMIRVHSVFGGSTVILPKDAEVSITASSVFGQVSILGQQRAGFASDIKISTPGFASASRRMNIAVSQVFGDARVEA